MGKIQKIGDRAMIIREACGLRYCMTNDYYHLVEVMGDELAQLACVKWHDELEDNKSIVRSNK